MTAQREKIEATGKAVAIYHVVYEHEGFEVAAQALFKLVQRAQERCPGRKRMLYLDIEGHRNTTGGFDADMLEVQQEFLLGCIGPFLSEIHCPMFHVSRPNGQSDDLPPVLIVRDERR